jgi:xanthine dehydrogenase accessory factor
MEAVEALQMPSTYNIVPHRVLTEDSQTAVLRFAVDAFQRGKVALAMLSGIRGGAARSLGSLIAVAEDGSFRGYVSGGCVEAAVASEALHAIACNADRQVLYGAGSPFFDIVLPCGGGLTIAIHVLRSTTEIGAVLEAVSNRLAGTLTYNPQQQWLSADLHIASTGWRKDLFHIQILPRVKIFVSGSGGEAVALQSIALAAGYEVVPFSSAAISDQWSAAVFLHHDLDCEIEEMRSALAGPAFYIGALGSYTTHQRRVERLISLGVSNDAITKINAPIGLFGPTRHSNALALSILSQIAACETEVFHPKGQS